MTSKAYGTPSVAQSQETRLPSSFETLVHHGPRPPVSCAGDGGENVAGFEGGSPSLEPLHDKVTSELEGPPEGHEWRMIYCAHCGYSHRIVLHCGDRTCSYCRDRDFWRLFHGYEESIRGKTDLKSVTLTLKNVPVGRLGEAVARQREGLKKLRRRRPYSRVWRGGLYAIEAVNKGRGWNVHAHLIVEGGYVPQARLSADWHDITGDSFIVDIQHVRNPEAILWHALKYVTKAPTLGTVANRVEYNQVLKGRRLIQTWGSWWGSFLLRLPPPLVCPDCGGTTWLSEFELDFLSAIAPVCSRGPPISVPLLCQPGRGFFFEQGFLFE